MWFMDVEWSILILYYNQIAMASMVYVFTEAPTGEPDENPPNSDG